MILAGILSDTHLAAANQQFLDLATRAFADCEVIIHAGDITSMNILQAEPFRQKTVYGVHGNMCDHTVRKELPRSRLITLEGYSIALCHGDGPRHNIEDRMWTLFPEADCIIYGHTHQPMCQKKGDVLFINPGSFQCTSPHGTPASYVLLEISEKGLSGQLKYINIR